MIQRIQSLFLFLAAISAAIMFVFPLANFYGDSNFTFYVYKLAFHDPEPSLQLSPYFLLPLMGVIILIILLTTLAIFSFKNRKRQMTLTKISMALTLILLAGYFLGYVGVLEKAVANAPEYDFASFMPVLVFVFLFLANRGIQKDEKLIRSMDRLR